MSEKRQKTVSFKNVSDNCLNCVIYLSEDCQIQNSVRNLSGENQKCIQNLSVVINMSENNQFEM